MIKTIKPSHPSEKDYLSLLKEFNRRGLLYPRYRELLRYEENYGPLQENEKILSNKSKEKGMKQ